MGLKPHLPQLADSISVNTSTSAMSAMHQRRRFEGNMRLPSPQPTDTTRPERDDEDKSITSENDRKVSFSQVENLFTTFAPETRLQHSSLLEINVVYGCT